VIKSSALRFQGEAFRQDGIKAWNDYQATGLHVTMEEADA
jgi:predicted transcriptional regulator